MNDFFNNIDNYQLIGILFVAAIIVHIILNLVLNYARIQAAKTKNTIDDLLIEAAAKPLKIVVWIGWLYLSIVILQKQINISDNIVNCIEITPMLMVAWVFVRVVSLFEKHIIDSNSRVKKDSIMLFSRLFKILIVIATILGVLQYFGFSISSVLTFGGVGGIVIGFAAKDMLSNIFGGIMIQMDRPFSVGDWIRSVDKGFEGTVEKIGWRMTRIRTFSKNPVYIPNSIFSTIPIETPSRMTNRRISEVIGIRYDDINQLPDIVKEVEVMLIAHDNIDHKQGVRVYFNHFNASSLDFNVYAFTSTIDKTTYQQVKQDILFAIAKIITSHKAEMAYPTQTLHVQK